MMMVAKYLTKIAVKFCEWVIYQQVLYLKIYQWKGATKLICSQFY